ncbi:MAG TPA: Gfo/Idh/MocA family oxidoreductase [Candidatus Limnocylindrales bacterium]|nr:Gfo/Idh/MocA family oxidoreductase [Candidatus Limnocylindrales bacterium]
MKKLRLGVIGAGSWTVSSHLPALERHRDKVEFSIVNRRDPDLLARIRDRFGFERATTDWREVVAAGCDIVLVASPVALHAEQAMAALEAGAHVLCEKPFTIDPAHAWDLVETARRVQREIVVAYGWNYRPMIVGARQLMEDDGGIGEIEQLTIHMSSHTRALLSGTGAYPAAAPESIPEQATWIDPALSGGGYGQAQFTHALGLALWLAPELRGREVFAFMSAPLDAPVELHGALSVRFVNGAIGTVGGGSEHHGPGNERHKVDVRLIGSRGNFHIDLEREVVWRYRGPDDDVQLPVAAGDGLYDCVGPVDALVELASGSGINRSPGELGARTVEILEAAYRSAASGRAEPVATIERS